MMFAEAASAPAALARQAGDASLYKDLAARLQLLDPPVIFTCARGSSDHAATYAKYLFETLCGVPVVSQSPSLVSIYNKPLTKAKRTLFLLISQSGRSPDLLLSAEAAKEAGALVVALVNDEASPLAALADIVLPMRAGPEQSVAATKSYLASLSAVARLAVMWSGDRARQAALDDLPEALSAAWALDWSEAIGDFADASSLFVLGRGSTLGIAQEAALKFKETCAIHAEAFSIAEVAHGPMELVTDRFPVLVLAPQDGASKGLGELLDRFAGRGARIRVVGGSSETRSRLPIVAEVHVDLAPIAMAQSFYRFVNAVALVRGRDPDRPAMLSKVTKTL
jgi:glucosamine--fructose-6-phosphate aminotransferase (isomerizing)